jgi:flagellar biosynthetic protein FlhB
MASDKTEKATPQRQKKAREQGQFLSAKEMVGALQFVAVLVVLSHMVPAWQDELRLSMTKLLERSVAAEMTLTEWVFLIRTLFLHTLTPLLLAGAILWVLTAGVHFAMTQGGFSLQKLMPKFDRFSPLNKLKELPMQNLKAVVTATLLMTVLGMAMRSFYEANADMLLHLPLETITRASAELGDALEGLLWKAAGVFLVFGAVDLFQQIKKHSSSMKMTKQEVKEEHKRSEGDPQMKGRIRRLRRDLLRRQMMKDVPKATAVVVNPTHFAIALRYEVDTMACPVVIAKGKNWVALRIKEIAKEHEIPIVENPPLARALHDALDVGRAIPPEFYKAIAEILAYVYQLMGRKMPG